MTAYSGSEYNYNKIADSDSLELKKIWTFDNYGFGYSRIKLTQDEKPVLITSSESGYILFINPLNGLVDSYVDVGEPVTDFIITDSNKIIAGTQKGSVALIDNYKIVKKANLNKMILKLNSISDKKAAALTLNGQLAVLDLTGHSIDE